MPSLGDYSAIRAELASVTQAAFAIDAADVEFGLQRLPKSTEDLPFAAWVLQPVPMSFASGAGTVRSLGQDFAFKGYFAFRKPEPQVMDEEDHKVEQFNIIAPLLEASELFAEVGMMPHVSLFDPTEWMDPMDGAHGFSLDFSTLVRRDWGT